MLVCIVFVAFSRNEPFCHTTANAPELKSSFFIEHQFWHNLWLNYSEHGTVFTCALQRIASSAGCTLCHHSGAMGALHLTLPGKRMTFSCKFRRIQLPYTFIIKSNGKFMIDSIRMETIYTKFIVIVEVDRSCSFFVYSFQSLNFLLFSLSLLEQVTFSLLPVN